MCRPRTLDEESMEYQRDLFVEVGRGHEDSMQVGRVEAPSRPNCTDELSLGREIGQTEGKLEVCLHHCHPIHCSTVLVTMHSCPTLGNRSDFNLFQESSLFVNFRARNSTPLVRGFNRARNCVSCRPLETLVDRSLLPAVHSCVRVRTRLISIPPRSAV